MVFQLRPVNHCGYIRAKFCKEDVDRVDDDEEKKKKKKVTSWILTSRQPHTEISVRRRKNRQPRGHNHIRARKTRKQNKDGEEDDEEESHKAKTVAKKEL